MDILVIVGEGAVAPSLEEKARHVVRVGGADDAALAAVVGDLRARIPREVAVVGGTPSTDAAAVARHLHRAGLPVELYTDAPRDAAALAGLVGVEIRPLREPGEPMDCVDSLLDLVGHTPLVRLDRTARSIHPTLLAKLETANPGGSVKDRPAIQMVLAAEAAGLLRPGGTIVEPTSGNTGVGLAIVAARRRYHCVFTVPDKVASDKVALLRAYGAEVIVCPTAVAPEHPESYYSVSDRLAKEIPGAWKPDQYHNPENPLAHELTTGPEIWDQTRGRVTHFVAGAGTGGTLSGIGRALKARNPQVRIIGADPQGSVYSGGTGRPYLVEGIGEDFWPSTYDPSVIDQVVMVRDADSFATARRVTREEGILLGGSGGTAVWAAVQIGRELGPDAVIVVLIPDSGRGYLSKLYNDAWMSDYGFLKAAGHTAGDVLSRRDASLPTLVHVHPDETVRAAIGYLKEYQVSQMPVVKAEPPVVAAEVVGSVAERDLMERAFADPGVLDRPVGEVMSPPLPTIGSGEPVDTAVSRLEGATAVLVLDLGHPVGIITRSDVLEFLTSSRSGPRAL